MKKRADGRYVQAITYRGKRKYFYAATQADMYRQIADFTEEKETGRKFSVVANEWASKHFETLAPYTYRDYNRILKAANAWFGDMRMTEIDTAAVQDWLAQAAEGKSRKTASNIMTVVNQIFRYAVQKKDCATNPCIEVSIPKSLKKKHKRSFPNKAQRQIVIDNRDVDEIGAIYYVCLFTGMRKGELLGLQWKSIDLEGRVINIGRSTYYIGTPKTKEPKTENSVRRIIIVAPLLEWLTARKRRMSPKPTDYLFSQDGGKTPWHSGHYNKENDKYKTRTQLGLTLHEMRHGFATICFDAGMPVKAVQHLLGHAQISTTMDIYTHWSEEAFEVAGEALDTYFASANM